MLGMSLKPYPRLEAYLARIASRPAVHAALLAEGLVKVQEGASLESVK